MSAEAEIRQLIPEDATAYRELMLEAYARHPEAFTASVAEREKEPLAWWEERTRQVTGAFLLGKLAGVAGLEPDAREKTKHRAKLFGMYVAPEARRRKVGEKLVQGVLEKASSLPGMQVVYLTVMEKNHPARKLYESRGFESYGLEPMAVFENGEYLAKVHMWRRL
jgi:ribosomal protein S18 acetylase RimI-like enzyme